MTRPIFFLALATAGTAVVLACSSSSDSNDAPVTTPPTDMPDAAVEAAVDAAASNPDCTAAKKCTYFPAGTAESTIQAAFATAKPGWTFMFAAGTFAFTNEATLGANDLSVVGAGIDKTILDFAKQASGTEGVFAQNVTNLRLEGFTVRDTKGNGVKVLGSTGVVFRKVKATWTAADPHGHGGYGLYPVQCKNVLVESCVAQGASDSGLYIGQSNNVIVRNNEALGNVAGIEIENTITAEVYGNDAHDNTGGILVFDLPGLQQLGGHAIRIHDNKIHDNNTANFAPFGNIVGSVPAGTGSFVMANSMVEFDHNTFTNNGSVQLAVVSYLVTSIAIKDPNYYPYPAKISIHDNTFVGTPKVVDMSTQLGSLLRSGLPAFPDMRVPDVIYDGITDSKITTPAENPMQICIHQTGSHLANLHLDQLDNVGSNLPAVIMMDPPGFDCTLPSVPAVILP